MDQKLVPEEGRRTMWRAGRRVIRKITLHYNVVSGLGNSEPKCSSFVASKVPPI
jgi:hypothetical protein